MANWKLAAEEEPHSEANWGGIMAKAQRLRLEGNVAIQQKEEGYVAGTVAGDHGVYNVQMAMADPFSGVIDQWHCECPWFKYAWDRTEKYKKYEGRFCSHALALYWQSQVEEPEKEPEEAAPEEEREEKPVEEQEMMWEEEEDLGLVEPTETEPAPREVQEPKVVSEVMPPPEPVEENQMQENPLMWQEQPEAPAPVEEPIYQEPIPLEAPGNPHFASNKSMQGIIKMRDLVRFYDGEK
jgi:hypothetical protein